jgi:phosphopantothenoylcysteine decarboxylase/phosphopantothenate--cysteine ligase
VANVVLGVSGSIAAWKACDVASKLVQQGHRVDVVMTRAARRFVGPLSFSALTHRRVFLDEGWGEGPDPHDHLRATQEAALLLVAPLTANQMAKFAHGIADEILSSTYLAAACPVLVAPAMNTRMWEHARTRENLGTLDDDGVQIVGPGTGFLSEGEMGPGRMAEPEAILEAAARWM